jgi:dihydrofolate reductase
MTAAQADSAKRRLCYQVASSLDGFIAAEDGSYDWIPMDPEIDFGALFARFDTLVMGRKTYETMQGYEGGLDDKGVYGKETVVFSRTLVPSEHPAVTVIGDDIVDAVTRLKARPGKDVWLFGGGNLFRQLLDAGVVDTVEVAVLPVMLGAGIPLVPPGKRVALQLTRHQLYPKTGTMLLEYDVRE